MVTADGFKPYVTQVSVAKDQIVTVDVSLQPLVAALTTAPTPVPTTATLSLPPSTVIPQQTRAGLDAVPIIGALALCGAVALYRNRRE